MILWSPYSPHTLSKPCVNDPYDLEGPQNLPKKASLGTSYDTFQIYRLEMVGVVRHLPSYLISALCERLRILTLSPPMTYKVIIGTQVKYLIKSLNSIPYPIENTS